MKLVNGNTAMRLSGGPHVYRSRQRCEELATGLVFFTSYRIEKANGIYVCDIYIRPDFAISRRTLLTVLNENSYDNYEISHPFAETSEGNGSRTIAAALAREDYLNEWWQFWMTNGL